MTARDPRYTCIACKAFQLHENSPTYGECRRWAPRLDNSNETAWPIVQPDAWCLEHVPLPESWT